MKFNEIRICILVADKLEEMQVIVPYDLWKRAGFIVELVSIEKKNTIILQNGVKISCPASLDNINLTQYNAIYLPGGDGYTKFTHPKTNPKLREYLVKDYLNKDNKWILANCSSPSILSEWNLNGTNLMTCSEGFQESFIDYFIDEPVVVSGNIITGNGTGSIIDFSFKVISTLLNEDKTIEISKIISYQKYLEAN